MKKIISTMLAVMMVVSLFAINVSATPFKADAVLLSQDFEDAENTLFGGAYAVLESEDSENHVMQFAAATERVWETNPPIFSINPGAKLTFKAMVRDEKSLSLKVGVYGGTKVAGENRAFVFVTEDLEPNVWYDCEIDIRATDWSIPALTDSATFTHPTTGEVKTASTVNTLSSNGKVVDETDDGIDNPVDIPNYTNRIRFITNATYGYDGTNKTVVTDEETGKMVCDWLVDDIKLESLANIPTNGVFCEQDFDDHANTLLRVHCYNPNTLAFTGAERGLVRDANYTSTGAYSDMLTHTYTEDTIDMLPLATDTTVTTFDICKKAPSAGIVVTLPRADSVARFGIVAKQLLTDVWYNFAVIRPASGKGSISVYRKQATETTWTKLTGVNSSAAVDAPAATNADVDEPIFINNTSSGNNQNNLMRFLVSTVGYMNVYQGADAPFNVAATPLAGSYYQVDNYKVALANDIELDVESIDNITTANVTVNENDPSDEVAKNAFIAFYNAAGNIIDVDFSEVEDGEATLTLSEGIEAKSSAKFFLWDTNGNPIMADWDITNILQ